MRHTYSVTLLVRFTPSCRLGKSPRPAHNRSQSRGKSPWRSHSYNSKWHCPFCNAKPMSTCPKCLGTHEVRPDCPPCNVSSLWDNSAPAHCKRDQQGRLLNKSRQILCWDFQQPCGCSGKGHNHKCLGCGDANHGAQECPLRQRTTSTPVK